MKNSHIEGLKYFVDKWSYSNVLTELKKIGEEKTLCEECPVELPRRILHFIDERLLCPWCILKSGKGHEYLKNN